MHLRALIVASAIVTLTGCATHNRAPAQLAPVAIEIAPARQLGAADTLPAQPANSVRSPLRVAQSTAPTRYSLDDGPLPLYRQPEIMEVEMDAYVNERNELVAPSTKHIVTRPGGWNMDAARNPHRAYIPAENIAPIPSANGYTAMVFPGQTHVGSRSDRAANPQDRGAIDLVNQANVRVLGFFSKADESTARSLVQQGEVLVYDKNLGYVAVPQAVLMSTPVVIDGPQGVTGGSRRSSAARDSDVQ